MRHHSEIERISQRGGRDAAIPRKRKTASGPAPTNSVLRVSTKRQGVAGTKRSALDAEIGLASKFAVTVVLALMVRQFAAFNGAPLQAVKILPPPGVAVRQTTAPET